MLHQLLLDACWVELGAGREPNQRGEERVVLTLNLHLHVAQQRRHAPHQTAVERVALRVLEALEHKVGHEAIIVLKLFQRLAGESPWRLALQQPYALQSLREVVAFHKLPMEVGYLLNELHPILLLLVVYRLHRFPNRYLARSRSACRGAEACGYFILGRALMVFSSAPMYLAMTGA